MRLIDADALIEDLKEHKIPFNADINEAIIVAPTIDAVEVMRCKDCEDAIRIGEDLFCPILDIFPTDDFYCADGERKEE